MKKIQDVHPARSIGAVPPARYSLRWRLPLLIAGLIALVVGTFLAVAYREVQTDLGHAAAARAQTAADQVGGLFAQSSQQRLAEF